VQALHRFLWQVQYLVSQGFYVVMSHTSYLTHDPNMVDPNLLASNWGTLWRILTELPGYASLLKGRVFAGVWRARVVVPAWGARACASASGAPGLPLCPPPPPAPAPGSPHARGAAPAPTHPARRRRPRERALALGLPVGARVHRRKRRAQLRAGRGALPPRDDGHPQLGPGRARVCQRDGPEPRGPRALPHLLQALQR
jgi:hypothetical protein